MPIAATVTTPFFDVPSGFEPETTESESVALPITPEDKTLLPDVPLGLEPKPWGPKPHELYPVILQDNLCWQYRIRTCVWDFSTAH